MARPKTPIRDALKVRGHSLAALARSAGVSRATFVRHLERGSHPAVRRAAARALRVRQSRLWSSRGPRAAVMPYEGATTGRRLGQWGLTSWGPNNAILGSLRAIRARARELVRNDPWAKRGLQMLVKEIVGTGIVPMWRTGDKDLDRLINDRFRRWTDESDADGQSDWYGQQAIVASEMIEAGEGLGRFRPRRSDDGLSVPLQIQVLEPDHLDENFTQPLANGRAVRLGIEFDARGRRTAYHLFRAHPGDVVPMSAQGEGTERVPVPAADVAHVYNIERAGQIRALPWYSPVILRAYVMSKFDDSTIERMASSAMFTGWLYPDAGQGAKGFPGVDGGATPAGQQIMDWEPNMIGVVPHGFGKVEFTEPPDPGAKYDEFMRFQLHALAAGMGPITYEHISGDLSQVNLSSIRAGLQEVRSLSEMLVWKTMVRQFCRPVALRWLEAAVLSGALEIRDYFENPAKYQDITWRPAAKPYSDPLKDIAANVMELRAAIKAPQDVILERGEDPEEVLDRIAEWNAKLKERAIISDANPAQTQKSGGLQAEDILREDLASGGR